VSWVFRTGPSGPWCWLPGDAHLKAYDGNTERRAKELGELADYLDAA
jgi:uncharacterized protein (DUF2252 family)